VLIYLEVLVCISLIIFVSIVLVYIVTGMKSWWMAVPTRMAAISPCKLLLFVSSYIMMAQPGAIFVIRR